MRDTTVLKAIAAAAAECNVIGADDNAVEIMRALEHLTQSAGYPREAFEEARELYLSLGDLDFLDLPERASPEMAQRCMTMLLTNTQMLLKAATSMVTCCDLLKDFWDITSLQPTPEQQ